MASQKEKINSNSHLHPTIGRIFTLEIQLIIKK